MKKKLVVILTSLILTVCSAIIFIGCKKDSISFNGFSLNGTELSITVDNDVEEFSFANAVAVSGDASYVVSADKYGSVTFLTKVVPLVEGDNVFFLFATVDEVATTYKVTIHRLMTCTVQFDTDGGSAVDTQYVIEGELASEPNVPTKTGYIFTGWNYDFIDPVTESVTIKASWSAKQYILTYDANGGTASKTSETINFDGQLTLPTAERAHYTFDGWYYQGQEISNGQWKYDSAAAIIAQWTPIDYSITYDLDGGSATNPANYNIETNTFTLNNPARTGYKFTGWTLDGQSTPTMIAIVEKGSTGNKTFTANWTPVNYSITYNLDGGTATNPDSYNIETETFTLNNPTKTGYTFKGWTFDGQTTPVTTVQVVKGSYGNKKLSAKWQANDYDVIYDANGGTATEVSDTVTFDSPFTLPDAERAGYTFMGWYNESNKVTGSVWKIPNDVTLVAKWEAIYSLTNDTIIGLTEHGKTLNTFIIPSTIDGVTITNIGDSAFYECNNLFEIEIPSSVESIDECAFMRCENLVKVVFASEATINHIGDSAFSECNNLCEIEIPASVCSIASNAFCYCENLEKVTFQKGISLEQISVGTFACTKLVEIEIPASVKRIETSAFNGCENLKTVTFEENSELTTIGAGAFHYCISLQTIQITSNTSVTLQDGCFNLCPNLKLVIPDSWDLQEVASSGLQHVRFPENSARTDINISWFEIVSIEIPTNVTNIETLTFCRCEGLSTIYYNGTQEQWDKISKEENWLPDKADNSTVEIICLK